MNSLFGNNMFFLFIFACITIMNYSRMTENQKMILFYLLTFGLAILKVTSVLESTLYLIIVSFFYLEFLTEDTIKIKFVRRLRYKIIDFLFLMIVQYRFFLFLISLILTSTKVQDYLVNHIITILESYKIEMIGPSELFFAINTISVIFFFFSIFEISKEKFKMKTFTALINEVFVPPINESELNRYMPYLDILTKIEDKTYYERKSSYNVLSIGFILLKLKQYWFKTRKEGMKGKMNEYFRGSKVFRGYSTLEMQLLRTIAVESGYYKIITRKIFEILYTNILFKSMDEYYAKNNFVNNDRFKDYLLTIYISDVRTRIAKVDYTKMTKYLNEKPKDWTKEKFYLCCLGLNFQKNFSDYYVYTLYENLIEEYNLDTKEIAAELQKLSEVERNYYQKNRI